MRTSAGTVWHKRVTPTVTAGAYSAGDVVGGLLTFAMDTAGGGVELRQITIVDEDNVKAAGRLWLFSEPPSTFADNAAFAPVIADAPYFRGYVSINADDYVTVNNIAHAMVSVLNLSLDVPRGNLYGYFVTSGTPTFTNTDALTIGLAVWTN